MAFQFEPDDRGPFGELAGFLRRLMRDEGGNALVCQFRPFEACLMKHQRQFETTASQQTAQTRALIADLYRIVQILNSAIAAEEKRARVFDRLQAEYPTHAR